MNPGPEPRSERACRAVALGFCLWTLCCHAVVAAGGSLQLAVALFALAAAGAGGAAWWARRRRAPGAPPADPPAPPLPPPGAIRTVARAAGVALAAALPLFVAARGEAWLWGGGLVCLAAGAAVFWWAEPVRVEPGVRDRRAEWALWGMALAASALALAIHRPDFDDSFYVNVAAAAADFPARPLLAGDTLLGIEGLPLYLPAHRIHSYEAALGALSWITGIPAIYGFHWVAAALAAALVPLALAVLFRLVAPRDWPWAVLATCVVLVAAGETHRWYGNFAFVRMWQGKAIYLFVFMPLVYAYALRFALRPGWARWGWLAAVQVAAVGCSSSAVWAAPAGAWMAMLAALRPNTEGLRRFAWGALASVYPLAAGLLLRGDMQAALAGPLAGEGRWPSLPDVLGEVLGGGRLQVFALACVFGSWAVCRRGLGQRFAIVLPLAVWAALLDPYARDWIVANLTGPSYWRSLWSLPVPILMALVLIAPLQLHATRGLRAAGRVACLAGLAAFAVAIPSYSTLSSRNGGAVGAGIRVGVPGLKVPEPAYDWAAALNASVPAGSVVVAPPRISAWVPTFQHSAHPLLARSSYMSKRLPYLGDADTRVRHAMTAYVAGVERGDDVAMIFRQGLDVYGVRGVCLRNAKTAPEAREILAGAGFERTLGATGYEIWVR